MTDTSWLDAGLDGTDGGADWKDEAAEQETPSEYGVHLDKWGQRRGEDLAEMGEFKASNLDAIDAADMFGIAFENHPELNEQCANPAKADFLRNLQSNDDFQALRQQTKLDNFASELAAISYGKQYVAYRVQRQKEEAKQPPGQQGQPKSAKDQLKEDMKCSAFAGKAVQQAQQEVEELNDARNALGIGSEGGQMASMSPEAVKKMFFRVKNNRGLRRMLDLAGKYRLAARAKQRNKTRHGFDDMIGITYGNDIGKLVPTELAALTDPVLEVDAIRRFAERQMMSRQYQGIQSVAKGPILIVIDESGSMAGDRIDNAKALALAMAWVARHQKRWCGFIGFSSRGKTRHLALPPDKWPAEAVMKWLENFLNGGTVLPTKEIPQLYDQMGAPKGKTDLIIITDGDTESLSPQEVKTYNDWKQRAQCKTIGITIASPAAVLQSISDQFYKIPALSPDNEAVESCLSV